MTEPLSPTQNSHTVSNVRVSSCPRTYLKQDEPEVIPISIPPSEAAKLAEDTSPRHVEYAPVSSIFEQATHNYQNTSVAFEKDHESSRAPSMPARSAASAGQAWNTLTSAPSRSSLKPVTSRTARGRRASVNFQDSNATGPRRLSCSSFNDDPTTDNSDVVMGQGTTTLETGARIPHSINYGGEEEIKSDIIIVEWDGDDQELGTTWSYLTRSYITLLVGALAIASSMTSSLPSMLIEGISEHFQVSEEVVKLSSFIFVAGYCLGPLIWAPYSELFGVRWPFILSTAGSTIFNMACALSPNIGGLIIFRFLAGTFGSCPLVVGGGAMANIWPKELLGLGMCLFSMSPMAGPSCGPLIGGYIAVEKASWRWGYWACTILTGFLTLLSFLTLRETNPGINLKKKARRLRKKTGDDRYKAPVELRTIEIREILTRWILLPILMFIYEPMLQAMTMYMSFVYGVLYLFFEAFPIVFGVYHGLNELQIGLTFMGFFSGCIMGGSFYSFVENRRYVTSMKSHPQGILPPEQRLMVALYGAPLLVISLFWFAWTSYSSVSIWSTIAASTVYGIAMFFIFVSTAPGY